MTENNHTGYDHHFENEFIIKNIDMYITREQILTWAFHLYGSKYSKSQGVNRVDMEHYAEQDLKKEKIKMIRKKANRNNKTTVQKEG